MWQFVYLFDLQALRLYLNYWASEANPTPQGCLSIFHVIMCRFVCFGKPKCIGGITWPKNAHAQFWAV